MGQDVSVRWVVGAICIVSRTITASFDPNAPVRFLLGGPDRRVTVQRFPDPEAGAFAFLASRHRYGLTGEQFWIHDGQDLGVFCGFMDVTAAGASSDWGRKAIQELRKRGVRVSNRPLTAEESREFWCADSEPA
jgi:hypothetical protein